MDINPADIINEACRFGAQQHPVEWLNLIRLIRNPQVVIEIGVDEGRSLQAWKKLYPEAKIYGIDLNNEIGDSHSDDAQAYVEMVTRKEKADFLFIDGDHSYEGAKADFVDYGRFVKPEGIIVLHDIVDHGPEFPDVTVNLFWNELKALVDHKEIIIDGRWGGYGVVTGEAWKTYCESLNPSKSSSASSLNSTTATDLPNSSQPASDGQPESPTSTEKSSKRSAS